MTKRIGGSVPASLALGGSAICTKGGSDVARFAESTKVSTSASREGWRALVLAIKAKLEAVEAGITTFETEFLAHIVLPDGRTVGEHAIPKLEETLRGEIPRLLPASFDPEVINA
jgi:hypothetical protein